MAWATYYLCRPDVGYDEQLNRAREAVGSDYVEHIVGETALDEELSVSGHFFHEWSNVPEPSWLTLAQLLTGQDYYSGQVGRSHRGMYLLRVVSGDQNHHFVISFGAAHAPAKKLFLERRFGKIVVSNAKLPDEVRGIDTHLYRGRGITMLQRSAQRGPFSDYYVAPRLSTVRTISAKIDSPTPVVARGGVGLYYVYPDAPDELGATFRQLLAWWNNGVEGDPELASLERFEVERDARIRSALEQALSGAILSADPNLSISLDDTALWDATSYHYLEKPGLSARNGAHLKDMGAFDVPSLCMAAQACQAAGFHSGLVRFVAKIGGTAEPYVNSLRDMLSFETVLNGQTYVFEEGEWFHVSVSWVQNISAKFHNFLASSAANLAGIDLPSYAIPKAGLNGLKGEDAYVPGLPDNWQGRSIGKFHKRFPPPAMNLKLEFCDVLIGQNALVFIKRGSAFDSVAEVCRQAAQTAKALVEHDGFATWVQADCLGPNGWAIDLDNRRTITFIVALIDKNASELAGRLTTRCKDCILEFHDTVATGFHFRTAFLAIDDQAT